jgi:hypothetical protein
LKQESKKLPNLDSEKSVLIVNKKGNIMGIFSAIIGNAGTVSPDELVKQYGRLLTENEEIELGFKLIRDTFIFTNKRLILVNVQGITGSKTEYKSVSYKSISRFSIETAGTFDLEAEIPGFFAVEIQR